MPPIRGRRSRVQNTNAVPADDNLLNSYSVQQLRDLCRQKKVASSGNKTTLLSRLRSSGPPVTSSDEREMENAQQNLHDNARAVRQNHVLNSDANSNIK